MGAGTPVVLRSGPRPRLAEEAILPTGGDMGILMGATGPEPESREEGHDEQPPGRRDEQELAPSGLAAMCFDNGLFSLVLHTAPLRHVTAAPDEPGG